MKIQLTQGKFATVDDSDVDLVLGYKWYAAKNKRTFYAQTGKCTKMHNLIANPTPGFIVDHIDGNGLNNQRKNLRICTVAENNRNKKPYSKSGYKGVYQSGKKWVAQIKGKHIGIYGTQKEAAIAYDSHAKRIFREFAKLNFDEAQNG